MHIRTDAGPRGVDQKYLNVATGSSGYEGLHFLCDIAEYCSEDSGFLALEFAGSWTCGIGRRHEGGSRAAAHPINQSCKYCWANKGKYEVATWYLQSSSSSCLNRQEEEREAGRLSLSGLMFLRTRIERLVAFFVAAAAANIRF